MNVAFDPWIPVVTLKGVRQLVSLEEVLTNGDRYSDLAVRPHERVSLMRLFLCVAHAALNGPKDYEEWKEVPARLPKTAKAYLEKWKDSFELFHKKKPWMQVAELNVLPSSKSDNGQDEGEWSSLTRLCFTRANGINSTLFDHESNGGPPTEYTPEEIVLNLLTFQNFFVAGGQASARLWGKAKLDNSYPEGGPCSGKSILFTFIRDRNLQESLYMNLSTFNDLEQIYPDFSQWVGRPLWEMPIKSPQDSKAVDNATKTHLGRLVPQTRILRINEDCKRVLMGPGFSYPKFQSKKNPFFPDPFATTITNRDGERDLLSAGPDLSVWRQLHSLLVRSKDASTSNRGPLCLLNVSEDRDCHIVVNSMVTNPSPGKVAEVLDLLESVFPIPSKLRSPVGTSTYEFEVKVAEGIEKRLGRAVEQYRKELDESWERSAKLSKGVLSAKLRSTASRNYWTMVEKDLSLLMAHIKVIGSEAASSTLKDWRAMLYNAARDAYRLACGRTTPRQMRAFTKGWQELTGNRRELTPIENQREEVTL